MEASGRQRPNVRDSDRDDTLKFAEHGNIQVAHVALDPLSRIGAHVRPVKHCSNDGLFRLTERIDKNERLDYKTSLHIFVTQFSANLAVSLGFPGMPRVVVGPLDTGIAGPLARAARLGPIVDLKVQASALGHVVAVLQVGAVAQPRISVGSHQRLIVKLVAGSARRGGARTFVARHVCTKGLDSVRHRLKSSADGPLHCSRSLQQGLYLGRLLRALPLFMRGHAQQGINLVHIDGGGVGAAGAFQRRAHASG